MVKAPSPLLGYKTLPVATITPDYRKILVFSAVFNIHNDLNNPDFIDFELYDPITKKSQALPFLPHNIHPKYSGLLSVTSYAFLDDSTFFICLDSRHNSMYTLNLEAPGQGWVAYESKSKPIPLSHKFFVVGGKYFTCNTVPTAPEARRGRLSFGRQRAIAFLDRGECRGDDDEGHSFCVLDSSLDDLDDLLECSATSIEPILDHPQVHIAEYKLKVTSCCGKEQPPKPSALGPLRFVLDSHEYFTFFPISLYPIWD